MKRAALLLFLVACAKEPEVDVRPQTAVPQTSAGPLAIEGAATPFLSATKSGLLLSWTESNSVRFARMTDGRWSAPKTIVQRDDLVLNWADFPSIVEDPNGILYAHWLQKSGAAKYSYDVRMAVSKDDGATWSDSFLLNRDGKEGEHGFVSLVPMPQGGVAATWLDGRTKEMQLRFATIDVNGRIVEDIELDPRTCECCGTGMALTGSGPLIVYRDRDANEIRDISYLARTGSGWSKPAPVHSDGWKIQGCPVNGPQIDAIGNRTAIAWFTAANNQDTVNASLDFGHPIRIDDGKPSGRVDILLLDEQTALVVWLEETQFRARRIHRDGRREEAFKVGDTIAARKSGFPRMARTGADVWVAFVDDRGTMRVERLALSS